MNRHFYVWLWLIVAGSGITTPETIAADSPPNVLVLLTDDQRWDTIAALGNPEIHTPNFDALVRRGFTFTNAYCMGSMVPAVCSPSRTMIMTGKSLWRIPNPANIAWSGPTLGSVFRNAGYATLYVGKRNNSFLSGNQVFETVVYDESRENHEERRAGSSEFHVTTAIDWLKKQSKGRPFLIFFAPPVPHDPRSAPAEFSRRYDPTKLSLSKNFMPRAVDNGALDVRDESLAPVPRTESDMKRHLADYYATITNLDHHVGRLLAELELSGRLANTLVVLTSDQGLAVGGRHGLMGKQNLYEHVKPPLVIAGPGIPPGESDALVYLFDLFPTLCHFAGLPVPSEIDGISLLPLVAAEKLEVREYLFAAYGTSQRMIRDAKWKLLVYRLANERRVQLFDLSSDPDELINRADVPQYAEILARLDKQLIESCKMFGDPVDF